jgi:hypothetical protein
VPDIWDVGRKSEVPAVDKALGFRPHVIVVAEVGVLEGGCGTALGLRNHSDPLGGSSGAVTTSPKKGFKIPSFSRRVIGTDS